MGKKPRVMRAARDKAIWQKLGTAGALLILLLAFSPVSAATDVQYDEAEPEAPLSNWWTNSVYPAEALALEEGDGFGHGTSGLGYEDYWPAPGDSWGDMPSVLMFTVSPANPKLYWIVGTADYYTGSGWAKTTNSSQVNSFPQLAESVAHIFNVEIITTSQNISLPVPEYQTDVTSIELLPQPAPPSLYLDSTAGMYGIEVPGLQESMRVSYYATYTPTLVDSSLIDMANVPENISQWYLQLPSDLPQEVRDLAENLKNTSLSTMNQILADVAYLKSNFSYDTGALTGAEATVENFEENGDASGIYTHATEISSGTGVGHLGSITEYSTGYYGTYPIYDSTDYFKIHVFPGENISVTLTPPSGADFNLWLYDNNYRPLDSSYNSGSATETVTGGVTSEDHYRYIRVVRSSGSGVYTLQVLTATPTSTEGDWVLSFIQEGKGTCMDFSAALAVILRLQGIPSRVNFGFKPGPVVGDRVLYLSSDGHSETEAYLPPYGWIRLDATPSVPTGDENGDTDGDGMPNSWETQYGLDSNSDDASQDADGDGYTNLQEYQGMSDPSDSSSHPGTDADGDAMPDTWENHYGLNPNLNDAGQDADGDGQTNLGEYQQGTNPNNEDTDGDGMSDEWENTYELNPTSDDASQDADGDGYTNLQEYQGMSDPSDSSSHPGTDADGDAMPDTWENQYGLNPNLDDAGQDADGEGYTNLQEHQGMSDPTDPSSHPGVDADGDGMPDTWENHYGLDPSDSSDASGDLDGDGDTNLEEYQQGTNPNDSASYPGADDTGNPAITDNQAQHPENQPGLTTTYLTLTITPENATRLESQTVTFAMSLRTASGLAYREIQLRDGTASEDIATLTTDSSGNASATRTYGTSDQLGEHYITASYAGDNIYALSSDTKVFLLYSPTTLTLDLASSTVRQGESLSFDGELKDDLDEGVSSKSITIYLDGEQVEGSSVTTGVGGKYQGSIVVGADLSLGYHQLQAKFESQASAYLSSQSITRTFQVLEAAEGVTPPENTQVSTENVAVAAAAPSDDTLLYLGTGIAAAIVVAIAVFKLMPRGKPTPEIKALMLPSPAGLRKLFGDFGRSKKYREGLIAAYKRFAEMLSEAEVYPVKEDQTARELSRDLSPKLKSFVRDDFDDFVTTYEKAMFTDRPISKTEYDEAAEKFLNSIKKVKVAESP